MLAKGLTFALLLWVSLSFTILQRKSAVKQDWPFSKCGDGDWDIESVDITPRPAKGVKVGMDVLGTATADTTFQDVFLTVKLNGVTIHTQTIPFQKSYVEGDSIEFKFAEDFPSYIPGGSYALTFQFRKKSSSGNGCIVIAFKL